MEVWLLGALAVLALIDSTSFGTLLVPVWLMLSPRLRVSSVVLFLLTVAGFYFVVGLLLLAGLGELLAVVGTWQDHRAVVVAQLLVGVGLFGYSFRFPWGATEPSARVRRWHERLSGERLGWQSVLLLALGAAALEVATMLPYLAAVGLLTTADLATPARIALLAAYVVVMVLPALVLLAARLAAARLLQPVLDRVGAWLLAHSGSTTGWVLGAVGFLVALDAWERL